MYKIFQKSRSHLKILGIRRKTGSKFYTEDPHMLVATVYEGGNFNSGNYLFTTDTI